MRCESSADRVSNAEDQVMKTGEDTRPALARLRAIIRPQIATASTLEPTPVELDEALESWLAGRLDPRDGAFLSECQAGNSEHRAVLFVRTVAQCREAEARLRDIAGLSSGDWENGWRLEGRRWFAITLKPQVDLATLARLAHGRAQALDGRELRLEALIADRLGDHVRDVFVVGSGRLRSAADGFAIETPYVDIATRTTTGCRVAEHYLAPIGRRGETWPGGWRLDSSRCFNFRIYPEL